ncbi:hypothetical protein L798_08216 [Zootermopsis nevadensis]|uniref:Uncharacterized protein n=1 Tax=Zootermopsis nevadensis TaxID=136037 RepID=A0A067R421_ZOONE|nr:hypothetical protein L798_08216 [Zootermopsis nevadensis]
MRLIDAINQDDTGKQELKMQLKKMPIIHSSSVVATLSSCLRSNWFFYANVYTG